MQQSTFGRALAGSDDELLEYRLVPAGAGAGSPFANVVPAPAARVPGIAFEVTEADLAAADRYEARDGYVRVMAGLASGRSSWVYVADTGG